MSGQGHAMHECGVRIGQRARNMHRLSAAILTLEPPGDQARVLQFADTDRYFEPAFDEIHETVRHDDVDPNLGIARQVIADCRRTCKTPNVTGTVMRNRSRGDAWSTPTSASAS
jgi:hypothetical protein